jgi:hypothetical protein
MMMKRIFTAQLLTVLLIQALSVQAQDSLFISELIDPADDYTGRFIELYNAGSEAIDFNADTYFLSRQSNGGTTWGDLQLAGSLAAGETFVIGGSGFEAIYGKAPDQESGILIGNGDDAYALFRGGDHETGTLHDIFGVIDVDGSGEPWEYTDSRAVRMEEVLTPSTSWISAQWEIIPANVADGDPGTHHGSVPGDTILPGTYSLALVPDTVMPGQLASIAVSVSELSMEDNIISFQFDIQYDTSALEFSGITVAGTLAEGGTAVVNPEMAGRLSVGYMNTDPLVGAGEILLLQFTALVPDSTVLILSNAYLNAVPVLDLAPATLIIAETAPPTAIITYGDTMNRFADTLEIRATFSEAMSAASPVRLSLSGAVSLTDAAMVRLSETVYTYLYQIPIASGEVTVNISGGTDLWGNLVVPVPEAGGTFTIIEFNPGDVNDDGAIQAYDAALALQYSVGIDPLPEVDPMPWEPWRDSTANVDGSGAITANDAGLILQYSAGIISGFPSGPEAPSSMAHVSLELVDDHIVFYSHGELLGLNINTNNRKGILGTPEILNKSFMSAVNVQNEEYRIGLCTTSSASEGDAVMRIPAIGSGSVTFHLIENTSEREVSINLATGMGKAEEEGISFHPNPVIDILKINGLNTTSSIRINNIHGQTLISTSLNKEAGELDLTALPSGLYLITVESAKSNVTRRFIKQ